MKAMLSGFMFAAVLSAAGSSLVAEGNAPAPLQAAEAKPAPPLVQLKVTVVLARYQGEKKVANLPYTFMVPSDGRQNVRMGSQVPIPSTGTSGQPVSYTYQNVGVSIDCIANQLTDGRYALQLTVSDSQVAPATAGPQPPSGAPVLQNFTTNNRVLLRDGQTIQFATATDKISGEVVKVDVTLDVVK